MISAIAALKLDSTAAEDFKKLVAWLLLLTPAQIKEVILDPEADKFT